MWRRIKGSVNVMLQVLLLLEPSVYQFGMCSFSKNMFPCIIEEKPYNSFQRTTEDIIRKVCQALNVFFSFLADVTAADGRHIIHSE